MFVAVHQRVEARVIARAVSASGRFFLRGATRSRPARAKAAGDQDGRSRRRATGDRGCSRPDRRPHRRAGRQPESDSRGLRAPTARQRHTINNDAVQILQAISLANAAPAARRRRPARGPSTSTSSTSPSRSMPESAAETYPAAGLAAAAAPAQPVPPATRARVRHHDRDPAPGATRRRQQTPPTPGPRPGPTAVNHAAQPAHDAAHHCRPPVCSVPSGFFSYLFFFQAGGREGEAPAHDPPESLTGSGCPRPRPPHSARRDRRAPTPAARVRRRLHPATAHGASPACFFSPRAAPSRATRAPWPQAPPGPAEARERRPAGRDAPGPTARPAR